MYRVQQQVQTQDVVSLEFSINHNNNSSEAGGGVPIPLPRVPISCGPLSLQRHRQFKHENLVPVLPTRYVLISLPPMIPQRGGGGGLGAGSGSAQSSATKRRGLSTNEGEDVAAEVTMQPSLSSPGLSPLPPSAPTPPRSNSSTTTKHQDPNRLTPPTTTNHHQQSNATSSLLAGSGSSAFLGGGGGGGSSSSGMYMRHCVNLLGIESLLSTVLDTVGVPDDVQIFVDASGSSSGGSPVCFLLLEMTNGEDALDVLYNVNIEAQLPFDVELCGQRRAVAFPCDPRPDYETQAGGSSTPVTGTSPTMTSAPPPTASRASVASSSSSFMDLPCCMLCCDRLEKTISGMHHRSVCCCPQDSCQCLMESSCVICAAVTPSGTTSADAPLDGNEFDAQPLRVMPRCDYCGAADDTWMCLVCGYVGCSRYHSQHAKLHFTQSGHEFAISVRTQQVWDYQDDTFVHRLLTSFYSGCRRLELGAGPSSASGAGSKDAPPGLKLPAGVGGGGKVHAAGSPYKSSSGGGAGGGSASYSAQSPTTVGMGPRLGSGAMGGGPGASSGNPAAAGTSSTSALGLTTKTVVDAKFDAKVEGICRDFTQTLTAQLEEQRRHYEAMIEEATAGSQDKKNTPNKSGSSRSTPPPQTAAEATAAVLDISTRMLSVFNSLHSDVHTIGTTVRSVVVDEEKLARMVGQDFKAKTAEEESLMKEQESVREETKRIMEEQTSQASDLKKKIADLREEIAEGKANLSARDKIAAGRAGDVVSAFVEGPAAPAAGGAKKSARPRPKKARGR